MQATSSSTEAAAASTSGGTGTNGEPMAMPLRACSTSGCRVSKYVEVTKRKCSQFVSAPYIMPKPLVVNGKTSIFQVGGEMAKMGDIPSLAAACGGGDGQPIYRIKPGTHAHVINYVFIDEGSDSMEKAKSEDQEAMRMLLDSQRESATAKLLKLISTHRGVAQAQTGAAVPAAASAIVSTSATTTAAPSVPIVAPADPATQANTAAKSASTVAASSPANRRVNVTTPQIHPNLSIASVKGALPLADPAKTTTSIPPTAPAKTKTKCTDNTINQLQAEVLKLRRTVARLGARDAK